MLFRVYKRVFDFFGWETSLVWVEKLVEVDNKTLKIKICDFIVKTIEKLFLNKNLKLNYFTWINIIDYNDFFYK